MLGLRNGLRSARGNSTAALPTHCPLTAHRLRDVLVQVFTVEACMWDGFPALVRQVLNACDGRLLLLSFIIIVTVLLNIT